MKKLIAICLAAICCCSVSVVSAQTIPDTVLKKNIVPITKPLQHLMKLQPKMFEYNTHGFKNVSLNPGLQFGFLAENLQDVYPTMVKPRYVSYMFGKNTYKGYVINNIDQQGLVPVLVAAVNELHAEVEKLKAEIKALKGK
jgi:hypothetical protein